MPTKVFVDGHILDPEDARISVFDRGFLYGDSVYEALRTSGGHPVGFEPHLDRLERSARSLMLELPPRVTIAKACRDTLAAAGNPESYMRIIVTRGAGEIGLDPALADQPSVVVIVRPLVLPPARQYSQGAALRIVAVERTRRRAVDPAVKSGNYLNNILALHEARRHGADEALMCNAEGFVAEGSTSNIFMVRGKRVVTPPLEVGLLPGITRQRVIDLARQADIVVVEANLTPEELRSADEAFITSSVRGVIPAATIDGQPLRLPTIGPTTGHIMALYSTYLADVAEGRGHA